ncbi:MAG: SciE type virulence protein [Planctomycetes bacterium]|nr:SciE type virulence protein [Planctomycetota bacterium]
MNAQDLFSAGKLPEAITAALEQVRNKPTDVNARFFLAELLCFDGAWERADKQMDVLMQQASEPNMFAILFRQLVRGEVAREQIFRDGRAPELMVELPEYAQDQIRICLEFRVGDLAAAKSLADRVEAARPQYQGQVNGKPFSGGVRDLDDRIGTVAELITAHGKCFWVPWESVKAIEFSKPERPLDLLWRKAKVDIANGPSGEVYMPVRYPMLQPASYSPDVKLSRGTEWLGDEQDAVCGIGQRMLLVGEDPVSILEIETLVRES